MQTRRAIVALSAFTVASLAGLGLTASGSAAGAAPSTTADQANPARTPLAPVDLAPGWPDGGDAVAVNEFGQVVVQGGPEQGAFLWTAGQLAPLVHDGEPIMPVDLNDRGQVVGTVMDDEGRASAVLWERGQSRVLPVPGVGASPLDLNNRGQVTALGFDLTGPEPSVRGYLYDGRAVVDLGVELFAVQPSLVLNDAGQVAGTKVEEGGPVYGTPSGFMWTRGQLVDLGTLGGGTQVTDLNQWGVVVGHSASASGGRHAFSWHNGQMVDLGTAGGDSSEAVAVNDSGVVVGQSTSSADGRVAVVWSHGTTTQVPAADGNDSQAIAVNNRGQVLVSSYGSAGPGTRYVTRGYQWQAGTLTPLGTFGGPASDPADLNESGAVIGTAENAAEQSRPALWWALG